MTKKQPFRLDPSIVPQSYHVELYLVPQEDFFSGQVKIVIQTQSPQTQIVLHASGISIKTVQYTPQDGSYKTLLYEVNDDEEQLSILDIPQDFWQKTTRGYVGEFCIFYRGMVGNNLRGLYRVSEGEKVVLCTQCQATDARRLFPCFDEPIFKARLSWVIHAPKDLLVLTNGALIDKKQDNERNDIIWSFEETRPIPTYLAALVVGDFTSLGISHYQKIPLDIYATRGKEIFTEFARDWTLKLFAWYEAYFKCAYPYGKYDQVAVPGFDAGAMENVGLVLFRQNALLLNSAQASFAEKRRVALVVAHELAHMWFGNLVTLKWWDELWLNEGFAEWIAHKVVHTLDPSLMVWDFFYESRELAMKEDAKISTHPIWTPVETAAEAMELFDVVTYEKGCAVIRMLENYIGEDLFKKVIQKYIAKFADGHSTGMELFGLFDEEASNQSISPLMHSWISHTGYPLVHMQLKSVQTEKGDIRNELTLSQERFFSNGKQKISSEDSLWSIPIVIRYADEEGIKEFKVNFELREQSILLPSYSKIHWSYINKEQIGFYRTHYEAGQLESLLSCLVQLSTSEQRGLLSDEFAILISGQKTIIDFVQLLPSYALLDKPWLLRDFTGYFSWLFNFCLDAYGNNMVVLLEQFVARQFIHLLENLFKRDVAMEPALRAIFEQSVIFLLGQLAHNEQVIHFARELVKKEQEDPSSVDPNIASICLRVIANVGAQEDYEQFLQTYKNRRDKVSSPEEKDRYLFVLPLFVKNKETIQQNLELLTGDLIPQESVQSFLSMMLRKRESEDLALQFSQNHWEELLSRVGAMGITRLVQSLGSVHPKHKKAIESFFEVHPVEHAKRALQSVLNQLDEYQKILDRNIPYESELVRFFSK